MLNLPLTVNVSGNVNVNIGISKRLERVVTRMLDVISGDLPLDDQQALQSIVDLTLGLHNQADHVAGK